MVVWVVAVWSGNMVMVDCRSLVRGWPLLKVATIWTMMMWSVRVVRVMRVVGVVPVRSVPVPQAAKQLAPGQLLRVRVRLFAVHRLRSAQ